MMTMRLLFLTLITLFLLQCNRKEELKDYPITPVPFTDVAITDHFWSTRIDTNTLVTIPFALHQCETTGRLMNFRVAGGVEEGTFSSRYPFDDSDVFKVIEGAAYSLHNHPDPALEAYLDTLISWIAAAQTEDGYLYTFRTILGEDSAVLDWAGGSRWEKTHLHSHELYNMGHLYEAAVAHYQATGKRNLLDVALKSAARVDADFGPDARVSYPGHQEIEIGLVKLFRLTGEPRYLELAQFFLDSRKGGEEYNQAHRPVTQQKEAVGHAVRATYMYSGMADVAALKGDTAYLTAIGRIWEDVVGTKLYVTGGIGAAGNIEGFSAPYDLPNHTAYCETCAGIATVLWNHRMFLLHGDAKYLDVMERTLYNNVLSGISLNGDSFFYPNPLESSGQYQRSEWFACACCPSNICRFIPSVPGYIYAHDEHSVYIELFVSSEVDINLGKNKISISQQSGLPWNGEATIQISPERPEKFSLKIRIPGWTSEAPVPSDLYTFLEKGTSTLLIKVNGIEMEYPVEAGFAVIDRTWKDGDEVFVQFPMDIRRIVAHAELKADSGMVALQRGPLVYCVEAADHPGYDLNEIKIRDDRVLSVSYHPEKLNGIMQIEGHSTHSSDLPFVAIPYYAWAHRGQGPMKVWIRRP